MAKCYNFTIDGNDLEVTRKKSQFFVNLNGQPYNVFDLSMEAKLIYFTEDYPITIGGKDYILAIRGNKVRFAYNGRYLDNNEEFRTRVLLPKWIWIFVALNLAILIISFNRLMNISYCFLGILICGIIGKSDKISTAVKVILSVVTTVAMWVLFAISLL